MSHRNRFRIRSRRQRRPLRRAAGCVLAPFIALWRLLTGLLGAILNITGRFVAILIGVLLIVVGVLVSLTIVGAIIGIPLALFGLLLIIRGFS
jgi:hypothetical protein